jgi:hypothetical protein
MTKANDIIDQAQKVVQAAEDLADMATGGSKRPHTSVYLSKPVLRELKLIAIHHERKMHDILLEAVNLVLAKYGRPSISDLGEK